MVLRKDLWGEDWGWENGVGKIIEKRSIVS